MTNWIEITEASDSLPPEGQRVLVTNGYRNVEWGGLYASYFDDDVKMRWLTGDLGTITHWMPEPDLPNSQYSSTIDIPTFSWQNLNIFKILPNRRI